ncbi:MAG: SH3 domain-containing protein [Bacteroidetes bacterium]|nr:SH3 domain-containing protein [Bacteroidota bacterium]MBL0017298.1 SH3 domain-containing protein [Bacteroidota bacterium]MBP6638875.1 SH3 domain-containing protein [Bacteroidia bacterium]MBP6721553.1 SH3 domain-containing protein [Bacteroidia bacterium]
MKNLSLFLLCLMMAFVFSACSSETKEGADDETETTSDADDSDADDNEDSNIALSTWDGHSAKDAPGNDAKWVASIAFGEELTLLNETETDSKTNKSFEKVKLLDGKEGWVRADFIAKGAELAAVTTDAQIYKRPGISNITDEVISAGTIVVLKGTKDEFSEFISKNDAAKKRKEGWLLGDKALTTNEDDLSAAILLSKALAEKNPAKRKEKLKQVADQYPNSVFAKTAQNNIDAVDASANLAEDELMIAGENVNVRSAPDVKSENKIFQLNTGDVCKILERGEMDEIGGKLDYWYKISSPAGKTGWVFGTFTSKAL